MVPRRVRVKQPQGRLVTRTRELLKACERPYIEIYGETKIQPSWLTAFASDRIPDPSVNKIETLYCFLTGSQLELR